MYLKPLKVTAKIRVIIITNAGDRAFCAGAALNEFAVLFGGGRD